MTDLPALVVEEIFSTSDFTLYFYPPAENKSALVDWLKKEQGQGENDLVENDYQVSLRIVGKDSNPAVAIEGRALACRCGASKSVAEGIWSVTLRHNTHGTNLSKVPQPAVDPNGASVWMANKDVNADFLNSRFELVDLLSQEVWHQLGEAMPSCARGLVAVFGATASGKNWVSRGLIHRYLTDSRVSDYYCQIKKRRPHLLTFEDPIEEWFWPPPPPRVAGPAGQCLGYQPPYKDPNKVPGLDYTPRQKDATADTLKKTLISALRQTPAAVYIGETREPRDWEYILKFAGTGHCVVTTAHAGSLTESVGILLGAMKARTPAKRRDVADRMVAVVHLIQTPIETTFEGKTATMTVTLPAAWLSTNSGRHNLMALGRGSILPAAKYCLGRHHFAKLLLQTAKERGVSIEPKVEKKFLVNILQMDLEGV